MPPKGVQCQSISGKITAKKAISKTATGNVAYISVAKFVVWSIFIFPVDTEIYRMYTTWHHTGTAVCNCDCVMDFKIFFVSIYKINDKWI